MFDESTPGILLHLYITDIKLLLKCFHKLRLFPLSNIIVLLFSRIFRLTLSECSCELA